MTVTSIDTRRKSLTLEQERTLAVRIEAGVLARELLDADTLLVPCPRTELRELVRDGERAWQQFFEANIGLVGAIVRDEVRRTSVPAEDLFQDGCVALGEAIMAFDHRRGVRFSSMAWPRIVGAVRNSALRAGGAITLTQGRRRLAVARAEAELRGVLGREVGPDEIARHLGRSTAWVHRAHEGEHLPLDGVEVAADEVVPKDEHDVDWMGELTSTERLVLRARYGYDGVVLTYRQLAARLGVSESSVRRIERTGLAHAKRLLAA